MKTGGRRGESVSEFPGPELSIPAQPAQALPGEILMDASCPQAALARLLQWLDPATDPRLVLGNTVDTSVRAVGDRMLWVDVVPPWTRAFAVRGYRLVRRRVRGLEDWRRACSVVVSGRPIVVEADTFYLDHYWLDYRRVHMLHWIVLEDFDSATSSVRLIDATTTTWFDGRTSLKKLEPAMLSGRNQAWSELTLSGGKRRARAALPPADELRARAAELVDGGADGSIPGVRLAGYLRDRLPAVLTGLQQRGASKTEEYPTDHLIGVMWNYHNTLRWFSQYLDARARLGDGSRAVESAAHIHRAAQDWVVARNLLLRLGVSDPVRIQRFARQVQLRLASSTGHMRAAAGALVSRHNHS